MRLPENGNMVLKKYRSVSDGDKARALTKRFLAMAMTKITTLSAVIYDVAN